MKLTNIRLAGNEHGLLQQGLLYADLVDDEGIRVISATLDYILEAIRDREYKVDGVSVKWIDCRGTKCSYVSLDKYA